MADNSNQIGILFGVEGGGKIDGASGSQIAEQLQTIANKLDGKIKFVASLDKSKTKKAILDQLKDIQSDIKLGLPEIDKKSSDRAINSFRSMSKKLSSAMADLTGFGGASFRNQNGFLLDKDLKSFQGSSKEILDKVKRFQSDYSKVAADMNKFQIGGTFNITKDTFQDANNVYQEFENLKLQAKQLRAINETFKAEKTGDLSHLKVLDSVTKYLQKYGDVMSKNTPGSYQRMIELSEKLKGGFFTGQGGAAQQEFLDIATNARLAGGEVETLGQKVKRVFDEKFAYGVLATLALYARRGIIQVYNNVVNLDTAMTELKKVTDETDATYNKFLDKAAERAQKLGATMSDVVSSTADFSRLGYSLDEATELADAAIVYKNVGDGIGDISEASESIISTMKAFGIEAKDAMTIVDRYNEVGNKFSISSKGVGDVLLRSASALQTAGNTLDEAIALGTSANSIVQDPEKVGSQYNVPTIKTAISVNILRRTRPSKDFISILNNLMIEVMGDFWHTNPLKYNKENLRDIQKKRIPRDKAKHTYIRNKYNIEILYLWENDIYNNIELCELLIKEYIKSNGNLKNYHSFNYIINDGEIVLNDEIIIPFQDR